VRGTDGSARLGVGGHRVSLVGMPLRRAESDATGTL
jgi:hypothetical protein